MLADTRIITASNGRYQALGQRSEIMFEDGGAMALHPVLQDGQPSTFLRCLRQGTKHLVVFDLRDVCRELDIEIRQSHPRDVPGLVFYTLRKHFKTLADAKAAALRLPIDMLIDEGPQQQAEEQAA